jgi:hypothetical protein
MLLADIGNLARIFADYGNIITAAATINKQVFFLIPDSVINAGFDELLLL